MKTGILKNYLRMEVLKIKFGNWNFKNLFENEFFFFKLNLQIGMEIRLFEKLEF